MYEFSMNYIAVVVVAAISFILGALWYSPFLFYKPWLKAFGKTEEEIKSGIKPVTYVLTFVAWLIASYVLAVFVDYSGSPTFGYGMLAGFLCWFGFAAATSLIHHLFAQRPLEMWLIDTGYVLVAFLISGGILAIWE